MLDGIYKLSKKENANDYMQCLNELTLNSKDLKAQKYLAAMINRLKDQKFES